MPIGIASVLRRYNVGVLAHSGQTGIDDKRLSRNGACVVRGQEQRHGRDVFAGDFDRDFLLRVVVEDVGAYERLLKSTLVHLPEVANMSSTFALRQVKYTTELPLSQLPPG